MSSKRGTFDHSGYISPFTWRYGSKEMQSLWSEETKRLLLRQVWIALAKAQQSAGIVTAEQVEDLEAHAGDIDISRASEIEQEIQHDLMAEIKTFAEQCPVGGSIIHLGATSMDVLDNVDALRLKKALGQILSRVKALLEVLIQQIESYADLPSMAFTHLQPAEPTTLGYRLAQYGQNLLEDYRELKRVEAAVKGKGIKGAVGTSASFTELLKGTGYSPREMERKVMDSIGLEAYEAATQVYPRKQDWNVVNALAGTAGTLYTMAFDVRILQSPPYGEIGEPFGSKQVGSSAMPFKRNPIKSEKINSLARYVASLPSALWNNTAHCLLERTLDDSANRRIILPEAFLALDEILSTALTVFSGLRVNNKGIEQNLEAYGIFASTERLLMETARRGADRQSMHGIIREHSVAAWEALQSGEGNPLKDSLSGDKRIKEFLTPQEIHDILDAGTYTGDAAERARKTAENIKQEIWQ